MSAQRPVVSVLRLEPRAGSEEALVRAYVELEVFQRASEGGGMRSGRLLEPIEPGQPFLVIAEWDDACDYERWLSSPVREELGGTISALLVDAPAAGSLYRDGAAWQEGAVRER